MVNLGVPRALNQLDTPKLYLKTLNCLIIFQSFA
jgi:hypothetical protein